MNPTFAVISFMREEPEVICRFIRHYEKLGASKVYVCLDGLIGDKDILELQKLESASVVLFDDKFWAATSAGVRPKFLDDAMISAREILMKRVASDWIFFCDADEFLVGNGTVADLLSLIPDEEDSIRICSYEAVWGPRDDITKPFGSTYFRRMLPTMFFIDRLLSILLFGRNHRIFRNGTLDHQSGKHFLRNGADLDSMTSHCSKRKGRPIGGFAHNSIDSGRDYFVAHFDAVCYERWAEKWRRRYSNESPSNAMDEKRNCQQCMVEQSIKNGTSRDVFRTFYRINVWQTLIYRIVGRVRRFNVF